MAEYDNPAGRLHDLLSKLGEQPRNGSIIAGWAAVLEVEQADVVLHLGRVADLVRQTEEAVDVSEAAALQPSVRRFRAAWTRAIFPEDQAFTGHLKTVLPPEEAMEMLGVVSAHLHLIASEGTVPEDDRLDELKTQVRDLIDGVREADDIPDDVKRLVITRLRGVEEAVEHLKVGGPRAVQNAIEAVMGSIVFARNRSVWKSSAVQKIWATLAVAWTIFAAGPTVHAAIDAWGEMIPLLGAGADQQQSTDGPPAKK